MHGAFGAAAVAVQEDEDGKVLLLLIRDIDEVRTFEVVFLGPRLGYVVRGRYEFWVLFG